MSKLKIALIVMIGLLAVVLLAVSVGSMLVFESNEFTLDIKLEGKSEITLEYGTAFQDPGAKAWFWGSVFMTDVREVENITVHNPVDVNKVGTYRITYTATYRNDEIDMTATTERIVHIVDTQAPSISLVADPDHTTYPGHAYEEEGFVAMDAYDGDITSKVERVEADGVVTYRVKDSSGNEAVVTRQIVYADLEAPILSLKGDNPMTMLVGTEFVDPGYIAWDGCDGYITENVQVTDVKTDPYVPNTYTIVYSITDKAGNTATAERILEVVGATNPETVTPSGKTIYLTFDDGPGPYTEQLLDVLKKYNVKVTFFVVNTSYMVKNNRYDLLKRMVDEGHAIAIHCTEHEYKTIYASEDAYFADLENMQNIIFEHTGVKTQLVRFPGGSSNTASRFNPGIMTRLTKALRARGYQYFDWNVDSKDAGGATTAEQVYNNVVNGCKGRRVSVVLQHDIKKYSVNAVEDIIKWGLENGYTFLPLDLTSPHAHHGVNN